MASSIGRMKRLLVAILVGTVVFGAVYAFAASLSVGSSSLGAGTSAVAACQSGILTASYAVTYDPSIPAYKVGIVTVSGLDTSSGHCGSKSYKVTLTRPGASNASLAETTGTTPSSGTTFSPDFTTSNVNAASVTGIHLVISG